MSTESRRINIYYNNKVVGKSVRELRSEYRTISNSIGHMNTRSKEYIAGAKQLGRINRELGKHRQAITGINRSWQQTKSVMLGAVGAASGLMIFQKVAAFIPDMIQRNADLSDSYADVMKTTDLSREATEALSGDFKKFNTRTPRKELLALAKIAGRLNIQGRRNIREFVDEANKINVALGEDLGEDAILQIGKIAAAFDVSMLQIGSAMNEIGNNSRAQEQYLVDFTARMQGAAKAAKIGAGDIVAYGGVFDAMGLKVEMTGTAMSTTLLDFVKDTDKFEQAAGMVEGSLSKMIGEKGTNEGFLGWIEALKAAHPEEDAFLKKLDEVGVSGARKSQVFLTLSQNLDEYRRQQVIANDALRDGTSVTEEYNIRNENLAATVEKIGRKMYEAFASSTIVTAIEKITTSLWNWMKIPLSEKLEEERMQMNMTMLEIGRLNVGNETRTKLIKDLTEQYPEYLKHIDAEKVSNDELKKAVDKVNESMVNKILLQQETEKIEKQAVSTADRKRQLIDAEKKLDSEIIELAEKKGLVYDLNASRMEQYRDLLDQMAKKHRDSGKNIFSSVRSLNKAANDYQDYLHFFDTETKNHEKLIDAREALKNRLGITDGQTSGPDTSSNPDQTRHQEELARLQEELDQLTNKSADDLTSQEKKRIETLGQEVLKMYEELMNSVGAKSDEIFYQSLPQTDQALIAMDAHYNKLREQAEEAMVTNNEDESVTEDERVKREQEILDQIKIINQTHDKEMDAYYADRDADRNQKKQELEDNLWMQSQSNQDQEIAAVLKQYEDEIALLEQYGVDTAKLTELIEKKLLEIKDKYRDKDIQNAADAQQIKKDITIQSLNDAAAMMDGYGQLLHGFNQLQKSILKDESEDQKEYTGFMIALQTAVAIANGVAKAMQASNPYEAIAIALGMAGTITSAVAQANNLNNSTSVPSYYTGTQSSKSGPAYINEEGYEMINLPAGSQVNTASRTAEMSNWFTPPSRTFSTQSYMSSLGQTSVPAGGGGGGSSAPAIDNAEMLAEMRATRKAMQEWAQKETRVTFVQKDYDQFTARTNAVKFQGSLHK